MGHESVASRHLEEGCCCCLLLPPASCFTMLVLDAEGGYQPVGAGNTLVRRARRHARLGAAIGCASLLLVVLLASRDR